MKKHKWGILAPGRMSGKFACALQLLENAELYAVGSRDLERAKTFADKYGIKKAYGSYEELVIDPEVEVIYIASPHVFHREHTLMCLKQGKHVLCEKVFAMDYSEVMEMIDEARSRHLFLMEALWPPFQPFYSKAKEILASGILGEIRHLHGYFSFIPPFDPMNRKFNLSLGGCSLHDIGIYPVIDALTFLGIPQDINALAKYSPTGSEITVNTILDYQSGQQATIYSSYETYKGIGCDILCEKGNMTVARGRDMKQRVSVDIFGQEKHEFLFDPPGQGYHWEAEEVMRCIDNKLIESPIVPHSFSVALIQVLDKIREAANIHFD